MGVVYQAVDREAAHLEDPHARIALKVLNDEIRSIPEAALGLQRESSRARRLAHPNIVRVYEFYRDGEHYFVTMELLEGQPWDRLIGANARGMPLEQARPLVQQLCSALTYAHAEGVVHSDLKPQNLFLTRDQRVKVLDFGIAMPVRQAAAGGEQTKYNPRRLGALSEAYACLELWQGLDPDPRDDVYSLACIVYELLSGVRPYGKETAPRAFEQQLIPAPIEALTGEQNRALRQALQLLRRDRTASVEEFVSAFSGQTHPGLASQRPLLFGLGATAIFLVAAIVLWTRSGNHVAAPVHSISQPMTHRDEVPGSSAEALANLLGLPKTTFRAGVMYPKSSIAAAVAHSERRVRLGTTTAQLEALLAACSACKREWYSDERDRDVVLQPFDMDVGPVTVLAFQDFVGSTGYLTEAEKAGGAYALTDGKLRWVPGGAWRNAVGTDRAEADRAVVAVSFADAKRYCLWRGQRLPTEDEWEYMARGPHATVYPWGDNPQPTRTLLTSQPAAMDGPEQGIGGRYRGLSGNVWQWVNTPAPEGETLKGGSWQEPIPNLRAAAHRFERPTRADADTGFRCAQSVANWPDTEFWMRQLE
jgi:serine/threonine protein kinase